LLLSIKNPYIHTYSLSFYSLRVLLKGTRWRSLHLVSFPYDIVYKECLFLFCITKFSDLFPCFGIRYISVSSQCRDRTMSRILEQVENKDGDIVKIYREQHLVDPLRPNDVVKMALKHSRYDLGHDLDVVDCANSLTELRSLIEETYDVAYIAEIHLYDHSGLRVKVGPFNGLSQGHAHFDSGPVGYAFITEDKTVDGWDDDKLEDVVVSQVEQLDKYLRGDVWRYEVVSNDEREEQLDSCGRFYDIENLKDYAGIAEETEVQI